MVDKEQKKKVFSKDELEKTLQAGIHGPPQLKKAERNMYLGNFRERVLKALTFSQIEENGTYEEIQDAIKDIRAKHLVLSRKADLGAAREYIDLARSRGLSFTTVDSPEFKGNIGLVVVSDKAIDEEDIMVLSRVDRLKSLGIPENIIKAEGKKICSKCMQTLKDKAPKEQKKYRSLTIIDRLLGIKCQACSGKK